MKRAPALLLLIIVFTLTGCSSQHTLTIGAKRFPESNILGEILLQMAQKTGETHPVLKQSLGNTGIVFNALKTGSIDVYPEYTGTIAIELLKDKSATTLPKINKDLAPMHLAAGVPLGFNDGYGLAMRESEAQRLGITKISDLAQHPSLKLGMSQELLQRPDGWVGMQAAYHLPFARPQGFDHGAAYVALNNHQVDVVDVYTTDAEIQKFHLRVLQDDRHFFPRYDAVLLYRDDLPQRFPKTWAAFQQLQGRISDSDMIALNVESEDDHDSFSAIAADFLAHKTPQATHKPGFLAILFGGDFLLETYQHLYLVFVSLAFSILAGVPLGIWAARRRWAAPGILGTVGIIQTIPSLALLVFLIPIVHRIGTVPTIIALFLYSLLPIVRNTYTGLTDISPALRESAEALGLPPFARLRLIELPLASRAILAGIKTSAVINVGTATIAAFIGAGGYGERINEGLQTYDYATLLSGAIPAAGLAILVQLGFDLVDRLLVPASLRKTPTR